MPPSSASSNRPKTQDLLKATLVLSKADLHVTELTLLARVEDPNPQSNSTHRVDRHPPLRGFRLTERSFKQLPTSAVEPKVFEPEPELLGSTGSRAPVLSPSHLFTPSLPPLVLASADLEMEVTYLLNQVKANMGEHISLTRTPEGQLRVEGIVFCLLPFAFCRDGSRSRNIGQHQRYRCGCPSRCDTWCEDCRDERQHRLETGSDHQ